MWDGICDVHASASPYDVSNGMHHAWGLASCLVPPPAAAPAGCGSRHLADTWSHVWRAAAACMQEAIPDIRKLEQQGIRWEMGWRCAEGQQGDCSAGLLVVGDQVPLAARLSVLHWVCIDRRPFPGGVPLNRFLRHRHTWSRRASAHQAAARCAGCIIHRLVGSSPSRGT